MRLIDLYPARGTFAPHKPVTLVAEIESDTPASAALRLTILHLASAVATLTQTVPLTRGTQRVVVDWNAPPVSPRGYGVRGELLNEADDALDSASTAFDVLPAWTSFPRYGFLTDFSPWRADIAETIDSLVRFHLNGLQFYDWQHRHDNLLPPEADYIDPLGRKLSLRVVSEFIDAAHTRGMAAMPYLTVYAASVEYWRAHSDDALYNSDGRPIPFGDNFLGLMNPAPGGAWARHLRDECARVLAALPFDGLHVDQYGDPKAAFDSSGRAVDLPSAFAAFITALKGSHANSAVVFNAVGNWPIEALAASPQDFAYIEIWPPAIRYRDVRQLVLNARALSGGKPVVIALYLPAERSANIRLADAVIFSCGGSRIELGERERLLSDPYFPKHQPLTPGLNTTLRRYYDFAVRYGDLIGPAASHMMECEMRTPDGVWAIARAAHDWLTVCLINVTGLDDPRWDESHPVPARRDEVTVELRISTKVSQVWWASPDSAHMDLSPLPFHAAGSLVSAIVPRLDYWALLTFKLDSQE